MTVLRILYSFNPRSYKRSDTQHHLKPVNFLAFNPRSYKRSDKTFAKSLEDIALSIHAPTRGATDWILNKIKEFQLSIHAPTRGATEMDELWKIGLKLSIHAPTRGATKKLFDGVGGFFLSIHAPTRGATEMFDYLCQFHLLSIHAPTRGATCEILKLTPDYYAFNPRSYKRSDSKNAQYSLCISAIIIA